MARRRPVGDRGGKIGLTVGMPGGFARRLLTWMRSGFRLAPSNRWPLADDRVTQVKQANDIVDVVGGYLSLRPVGATFKGLCPFHEDTHPSFDVDPRRQRYKCWSCGKFGDVLSFVQEFERVTFPEALELLARRAGITLERSGKANQGQGRALLLDVMRWAAKLFHECLLDSPAAEAEAARVYLSERGLRGETVRRWGLGYAPPSGQWLIDHAERQKVSLELLQQVGLIAARDEGSGFYSRFRDRLQFPIRECAGRRSASAAGFCRPRRWRRAGRSTTTRPTRRSSPRATCSTGSTWPGSRPRRWATSPSSKATPTC